MNPPQYAVGSDTSADSDGSMVPPVVLIAEDEHSIASVVAEIVQEVGGTPVVAAQGQQALELAQHTWPQLLITDLMMPRMGGAELIAALRDLALSLKVKAPPVLLLTAASGQYAHAVKADMVIRKPFNIFDLEEAIRHLIGRSDDATT